MAKKAKLNRSTAENIAIRAQVDAYMAQGLPIANAQAAAFKDFAAGKIKASKPAKPRRSVTALARQISRRKAATAAAFAMATRSRTGRKRTTKKKK